MKTRRILMLNQEYPPIGGGAGYVTAQLIRHLSGRGFSVDLITMQYRGLPAFREKGNVRIYRVRSIRRHRSVSNIFELFTHLRPTVNCQHCTPASHPLQKSPPPAETA